MKALKREEFDPQGTPRISGAPMSSSRSCHQRFLDLKMFIENYAFVIHFIMDR